MRTFEISISIDAPAETVWAMLTNFEGYPEWNPTLPRVEGHLREGGSLTIWLGKNRHKDTAHIDRVEEGKILTLSRPFLHRVLVHMEHDFELIPQKEGVVFIQRWRSRGILVPLLWNKMTRGMQKFDRMNEALKEKAETCK